MNARLKFAAVSVSALAFLGACGGSPETPTPSAGPSVSSTAEERNGLGQTRDQFDSAMVTAWSKMPDSAKETVCNGWGMGFNETLLDSFTEGAGKDDPLTRKWASEWFDKTC